MRNPIDAKLNFKNSIKLMLKGFCMGVADIIPGISGGTIAFILGIYEDWIDSIKSFDVDFIKKLLKLKFVDAFNHAAWQFILTLLCGMGAAIFTLSNVLSWLLVNKPTMVHAFFFGLILATIPIIARHIKEWSVNMIMVIVGASIFSYYSVGLVPVQTPNEMWFVFLSGAIALCAMILPGISGAFILLLLGKYAFIVNAVNEKNLLVLTVFGLGGIAGVLTMVRLLSWLLHKYHSVTIAFLTGLVIGSLRKIWPWKEVVEVRVISPEKILPIKEINILPAQFNTETLLAVLMIGAGLFVAYLLDAMSKEEAWNE